MIKIKLEGEKYDIKTEGNFTSALTEFTTGIPKAMEELLTECNVKKESWAGYVRYLIDALEDKFL